eukprot:Phypoly_transcript_16311.p1 GENE.Phypoly_transcript_16311~~Phypoly_transcript_16311.p1  ORF type:complete len:286 (+),score=51.80 Phypoly_transcript_16311:79-858(+)
MEEDNGMSIDIEGETDGGGTDDLEGDGEYSFESMVAQMEREKKIKAQKALRGHANTVHRLKKYSIVQKALSGEELNPTQREEALRKVAADATQALLSSPQRPRSPHSPGSPHRSHSPHRPESPLRSDSPLRSHSPHRAHSPHRPHTPPSPTPLRTSSPKPVRATIAARPSSSSSPKYSRDATRDGVKSVDDQSIPTPAREEYLQMQRSIAHLPQEERYKQEKGWLENWTKTHTATPIKQGPKGLYNTKTDLSKVDLTPW